MQIRRYRFADIAQVLALFYGTVHTVNAADYTPEQLDAWAPEEADAAAWDASLSAHFKPAPSMSPNPTTAPFSTATTIVTHASVTAKPFFEKRGYVVVKKQQVERRGVRLFNFIMKKER